MSKRTKPDASDIIAARDYGIFPSDLHDNPGVNVEAVKLAGRIRKLVRRAFRDGIRCTFRDAKDASWSNRDRLYAKYGVRR